MDRRTRNRLCIWVMSVGVLNLTVYTAFYASLGGDAINGRIDLQPDGTRQYILRGHFLRGPRGQERTCSAALWVYSYVHSMSIIPTCVAVLVPLIILARPHIIATMHEGAWIQGTTTLTIAMTILIVLAALWTVWFGLSFAQQMWG